jgi:hypothetical protein
MSTKTDYVDEEWMHLRRAPFVVAAGITISDPGGPIEIAHETTGALKAASSPPSREQLLIEVSQEISSMVAQKQNPLEGFKPEGSTPADQMVLDEIGVVNDILDAKATPEEAAAFRKWLLDVAQATADAAKEGGFLGIGAVRVSEGEQSMLDRLRSTLGVMDA